MIHLQKNIRAKLGTVFATESSDMLKTFHTSFFGSLTTMQQNFDEK